MWVNRTWTLCSVQHTKFLCEFTVWAQDIYTPLTKHVGVTMVDDLGCLFTWNCATLKLTLTNLFPFDYGWNRSHSRTSVFSLEYVGSLLWGTCKYSMHNECTDHHLPAPVGSSMLRYTLTHRTNSWLNHMCAMKGKSALPSLMTLRHIEALMFHIPKYRWSLLIISYSLVILHMIYIV